MRRSYMVDTVFLRNEHGELGFLLLMLHEAVKLRSLTHFPCKVCFLLCKIRKVELGFNNGKNNSLPPVSETDPLITQSTKLPTKLFSYGLL